MAKIGLLIETSDTGLKDANFGVITAARGKGDNELYAFVMGTDVELCTKELAQYGVSKIIDLQVQGVDLGLKPAVAARAVIAAMEQFEIKALLGLSSSKGRDILARIAAATNSPLVLDCLSVNIDESTVTKPYFAGKTIATVKLKGELFLSAIRPNAIEQSEAPCQAEVIPFSSEIADESNFVVKEIKKSTSGKIDLSEANVIITGGRPVGSKENFGIFERCAEALGGAVGASRVAVDSGYASHAMQVGQTGKTVNPKLYIACGVSGSVQHFAGMKTSKIIVAINTDKDAPILNKCDYGIIGDMFEIIPALTEALSK